MNIQQNVFWISESCVFSFLRRLRENFEISHFPPHSEPANNTFCN